MTAVQKKMEEFIRRERLLEMGDRVVLGVSGGADSVCMMELFAAIREAWQLELLVVHVHHGLRGAEADRDASFVQAEAEKLGIDCVVEQRAVRSLAAERGLSLEEAGRDVRYEILREYAKTGQARKTACVMAAGVKPWSWQVAVRRRLPWPTIRKIRQKPFSTTCSGAVD